MLTGEITAIIIKIIIIIFIIIVCIYLLNKGAKQEVKEEMQEQKFQEIQQQSINMNIQNNTMTEKEYREKSLQQMQSININIIQLQSQLDKQNKEIKEIEKNVGCITFVIVFPIIIGIVIFILKAKIGYNILQDLTDSFNNTPTAIVHVEDENGNIIYNEEYHGQNVAVPAK